jgi:hypothetical protein
VFPSKNIRNYLSIYEEVVFAIPLADNHDEILAATGATERELVELASLGRVRFVVPQAIDRYRISFLSKLAQDAPNSLLLSRQLASATIVDVRRRVPFLYPRMSARIRHQFLHTLYHMSSRIEDVRAKRWIELMLTELCQIWAQAEDMLHHRGAMATSTLGLGSLVGAMIKAERGIDARLEFWSAAMGVEWAGALGATIAPIEAEGYSEQVHSEIVAGMYSGIRKNQIPTISSEAYSVMDKILAVDADAPLIEFAKTFSGPDIDKFRNLVLRMARENLDPETLEQSVMAFNSAVKQYENKPNRLKSWDIRGLLVAGAGALAVRHPELGVAPLIPFGGWLLGLMVTLMGEGLASRSRIAGAIHDMLNGLLSRTPADAVLVSRMRGQLKTLK